MMIMLNTLITPSDRTVIIDVLTESHFYSSHPSLTDAHQLVTILTFIQYVIEQPLPKDNVYLPDIRLFMQTVRVETKQLV